jgi:hypothetical protein
LLDYVLRLCPFLPARGAPGIPLSEEERAERAARREERDRSRAADAARKRTRWLNRWSHAKPYHEQPEIAAYLARRKVEAPPNVFRVTGFENSKTRAHASGMMAEIVDPVSGDAFAFHVTYLDAHGNKIEWAFDEEKKAARITPGMTADKGVGVIRLLEGTGNAARALCLGEGIETALSFMQIPEAKGATIWAGITSGNMARLPALDAFDSIMVAVDIESAGAGEKASRALATRWAHAGKRVLLLTPILPSGKNKFDLNDVVRVEGGAVKDVNYRIERFEAPTGKTDDAQPDRDAPPIGDDRPMPNFRSLAEFCAEFRPISYAVAGLMREGSLYTLTGRTGEGKTAFLVILALAIATGQGEKLIGRKVKQGRVAFCTAENPDDLRMRLMIACFIFGIDVRVIDRNLMISDNRVSPEAITEWIKTSAIDFTLIIVDTWQAYFDGQNSNNPTEAVNFTRRFRPLANLAGAPVAIIAAHPNKIAADDRLIPNGAGSTLNEVDGNFTMLRDSAGLHCLHWLGKIRGVPFEPLYFKIERFDSPDVVTIERARVQMPVMSPVSENAVDDRREALAKRDITLLKAIAADPTGSERKWALDANIARRTVQTMLDRLQRERIVTKKARRWSLTKEGERLATMPEPLEPPLEI